ncbi:MAG: efflux RND transporter periplasmic adaptor subunit [Xanthobacteraceae bacterium]
MCFPRRQLFYRTTVAMVAGVLALPTLAQHARAQTPARPDASGQKQWAAVAPGRVESVSREIRITAPMIGRIAEVLVKPNDKVFAGELLIRLDDEELLARLAVAEAQVAMRKRARDTQSASRQSLNRRKAEDALADAERAFADARSTLDKAAADRRKGSGSEESVTAAQAAFTKARETLETEQAELRKLKADDDTPLPNRNEGELNVGRAELAAAEQAVEKTRIRAPIAGTILQVQAKVGELATPSPDQPLLIMGDLSSLRVRAEVDERDIADVRVGQPVVVRAHAFRGREFAGEVASIARLVGPGVINSRSQRKLTDVDVVEVVIDLTDPGPLAVGMQADVYFRTNDK